MPELHPQDWLLIAEALAGHCGPEIDTDRDRRAWVLTGEIAEEQGLEIDEIPRQVEF